MCCNIPGDKNIVLAENGPSEIQKAHKFFYKLMKLSELTDYLNFAGSLVRRTVPIQCMPYKLHQSVGMVDDDNS